MLSAFSLFYFRTLVEAEHILTRAPSWSKARLESRRQSSDACRERGSVGYMAIS